MKKLVLLFAVVFTACSNDDSVSTTNGSIEVLSYSHQQNSVLGGYVYKHSAEVSNTTDNTANGNVVFEYKQGNTVSREYIPISLPSNQTATFTGSWGMIVHQSDNDSPISVTFVND